MKTTVAPDEDLAELIAELARAIRKLLKTVLNDASRGGLVEPPTRQPEFLLRPHAGHLLPGIDEHRFNELAWEVPATKQ